MTILQPLPCFVLIRVCLQMEKLQNHCERIAARTLLANSSHMRHALALATDYSNSGQKIGHWLNFFTIPFNPYISAFSLRQIAYTEVLS